LDRPVAYIVYYVHVPVTEHYCSKVATDNNFQSHYDVINVQKTCEAAEKEGDMNTPTTRTEHEYGYYNVTNSPDGDTDSAYEQPVVYAGGSTG